MVVKNFDDKYCMDEGFCIINQTDIKNVDRHTHNFVEFVYMLSGRCVHMVDGIEYPAKKGDMLFINYNSEHSIKSNDGVDYADILIKPEYISDSLVNSDNIFSLLNLTGFEEFIDIINKESCFMSFSGEEQKRLETIICWITEEEKNTPPATGIVLKSGINMLLTMIFRKMSLPISQSMSVDYKLLLYIKKNCSSNISMLQIAQKCGYSSAYFSRLFKEFTGTTFSDYVTVCRIEKACALLKNSDFTVEEIIYNCGFTNRTRFFKIFTEKLGTTPKNYRKCQN